MTAQISAYGRLSGRVEPHIQSRNEGHKGFKAYR